MLSILALVVHIALTIEGEEEEQKYEGIAHCQIHESRGEGAARSEHGLQGVDDQGDKLGHLNCGQISLPPQIWRHSGSKGGQPIV